MLPTRSSSVRHQPSPAVRRAHFRDDSHLIALRYEKTKAAEPPIPMLPRIPSVHRKQYSSSTSKTPLAYKPVVVVPPHSVPPVMAPPTEQHPALRSTKAEEEVDLQPGKRDSGHAPASLSSTSIPEKDCYLDKNAQIGTKMTNILITGTESFEICPKVAEGSAHDRLHHTGIDAAAPETPYTVKGSGAPASPRLPASTYTSATVPSTPTQYLHSARKFIKRRHSGRSSIWSSSKSFVTDSTTTVFSRAVVDNEPTMWAQTTPASVTSEKPPFCSLTPTSSSITSSSNSSTSDYFSLGVAIPTDQALDDDFISGLKFSQRGSIIFGGERAMSHETATERFGSDDNSVTPTHSSPTRTRATLPSHDEVPDSLERLLTPQSAASMNPPEIRVLTPDAEKESQKVRSLYQTGDTINWEDGARHSFCERLESTPEVPTEEIENAHVNDAHQTARLGPASYIPKSAGSLSRAPDIVKKETELAGGIEDWEDVDGALVDRFGFITAPRPGSRVSTPTELKSAQYSPRRRNVLHKRDPFAIGQEARRTPSRKVSARSLYTQNSEMSVVSFRSSRSVIRQAGNWLPHNRNRRWMDEAGGMLTVSPSLQDVDEESRIEKISDALKRKEWHRSEKWRKMAKVLRKGDEGQGMEFEFDMKSPKLIERTWKGIPDRWRGAAWWAFLASAAKEQPGSAVEADVIVAFHRLQEQGSADDVQIDLDVPRTIGRHIMFRKRYRGGQRLLFRVLHALSLYFPETGYVQGMASLAATLLCYFDEEKSFVMLVRMWQLRGLERLYRPGFEGLMLALREFETGWLNKDVADRLNQLCIDGTAYGTRWYLTLFNLSIPFPAQLRVWDVFMLLGDTATGSLPTHPLSQTAVATTDVTSGLDILHATSAALIQALREVLLDSDFENAMKALTSWISVKDEELLMKVTKAEWKTQKSKKKT